MSWCFGLFFPCCRKSFPSPFSQNRFSLIFLETLIMEEHLSPIFSVPTTLGDLEEDPYNLLPYPADFDEDADDMSRAAAFDELVTFGDKV